MIMKIEKIHLNKIKVTFSPEDLTEHNITPEAVKNNAPWIQRVLMMVVRKAEEEMGFSAADCRLMVEAMPGDDDSMVMYITKVDNDEDLKNLLNNVKKKMRLKVRPASEKNTLCISFYDFEDAVRLSRHASFSGGELYFYKDSYHMLFHGNTNFPFAEFGKTTTEDGIVNSISEHGKLISDNALDMLRDYF